MKNVLHLISSNGFYGAENVLLEICLGLQSSPRFHPVIGLLNTGNRGHLALLRECRKHNLAYREFSCRGRYDRSLIRELKGFVENNDIKIVHSHGYKSNFYAYFARLPGLSLVTTCHNWIASGFKMRCFTWLDKILLRYFDSVVCVSRPIQVELERWRVKNTLSLIYNGIDINRFRKNSTRRKEIRHRLGLTDTEVVIGFVGRVSREKGISILMECGADIHAAFPELHIVIVGDGPLKTELESEGIDYVHFVGVQSDVASFYSAFDIFILPSLTEGLPMVILEAMASSLPVVASDVGSIPDVVEDGQTGYLIQPERKKTVYDALEQLIRSPLQARKMGENGLEKVERIFTSDKMVQQYISVYDSLN